LVFITKVVLFVTEETLALVARPVPDKDMPLIRPAVLPQVTLVLAAVVVALFKLTPAAVRLSPVPVPVAACERTKAVAFVIEATDVLPVATPLVLPGMLGPEIGIPVHSPAVLAQVTVVLPLVVVVAEMLRGVVWFELPEARRTLPAPMVAHELSAPVPFQLFEEALLNTSRQMVVLTGVAVL
jgi:hypothetical protein